MLGLHNVASEWLLANMVTFAPEEKHTYIEVYANRSQSTSESGADHQEPFVGDSSHSRKQNKLNLYVGRSPNR